MRAKTVGRMYRINSVVMRRDSVIFGGQRETNLIRTQHLHRTSQTAHW